MESRRQWKIWPQTSVSKSERTPQQPDNLHSQTLPRQGLGMIGLSTGFGCGLPADSVIFKLKSAIAGFAPRLPEISSVASGGSPFADGPRIRSTPIHAHPPTPAREEVIPCPFDRAICALDARVISVKHSDPNPVSTGRFASKSPIPFYWRARIITYEQIAIVLPGNNAPGFPRTWMHACPNGLDLWKTPGVRVCGSDDWRAATP